MKVDEIFSSTLMTTPKMLKQTLEKNLKKRHRFLCVPLGKHVYAEPSPQGT